MKRLMVVVVCALWVFCPSLAVKAMKRASLPAMDDFTGNNLDPLEGNWTVCAGTSGSIYNGGNYLTSNQTGYSTAKWTGDTFASGPADQYAEVVVNIGNSYDGPAVRITCSGTNSVTAYGITVPYGIPDAFFILKYDGAGSHSAILTDTTYDVAPGDVVRLEATGGSPTTLKYYVNGVFINSVVDSSSPLTTGVPGVVACCSSVASLDNFQADNVASGGSTFPSAILGQRPIRGGNLWQRPQGGR